MTERGVPQPAAERNQKPPTARTPPRTARRPRISSRFSCIPGQKHGGTTPSLASPELDGAAAPQRPTPQDTARRRNLPPRDTGKRSRPDLGREATPLEEYRIPLAGPRGVRRSSGAPDVGVASSHHVTEIAFWTNPEPSMRMASSGPARFLLSVATTGLALTPRRLSATGRESAGHSRAMRRGKDLPIDPSPCPGKSRCLCRSTYDGDDH